MRGGPLQEFIENTRCYESLPRREHTPVLCIAPVTDRKYRGEFFWLTDGEQRIGLLNLNFGEIEMFRFFPPTGPAVRYRMPHFHGWSTLQGPRISIVPQGTWTGKGRMVRLRGGTQTLALEYTEDLDGGGTMNQRFTLRFDPVLGYVWDCVFKLRMKEPRRFEYSNLLPASVAESRTERKRYQKCIWTRSDGKLCAMYQNPLSMMHAFGPEWARIPPDGGFVGFVAEYDRNPFIEIIESRPATTFITCSVWYDQHVVATAPEHPDDDGFYRAEARYRLLSLPLAVAKELEDAALTALPSSSRGAAMGFRQNVVNDFETLVRAGTLYNGCIWGHSARYDDTVGHSGTHSLRLNGGETAQPVHGGPLLHVQAGKRYRFRGWVRTRGVTGKGAYLRVKPGKVPGRERRSRPLTGNNDWTRVEIVFRAARGQAFVVPGLVVEGTGKAWFDDLELMDVP